MAFSKRNGMIVSDDSVIRADSAPAKPSRKRLNLIPRVPMEGENQNCFLCLTKNKRRISPNACTTSTVMSLLAPHKAFMFRPCCVFSEA